MVTKRDDAKRIAALAKILPVMRELHEKQGAMIEEFEAIVGGGPTIGDKLKHFETYWSELWAWRYGEPYAWPASGNEYAKHRGQMKTLFKKLTLDGTKRRAANYMRNSEDFFTSKKHPWGLFVATINQHVNAREEELAQRPEGCRHDPPCADQFEHTRKRQAEQTT